MPISSAGEYKARKPRPSRARGLRTTTGCLTCRARRVKCDELRPRCASCAKSDRECTWMSTPSSTPASTSAPSETQGPIVSSSRGGSGSIGPKSAKSELSPAISQTSIATTVDPQLSHNSPELPFESPHINLTSIPSPNSAPLEWYDLLAEDAVNNIDKYNLNLEVDRPRRSTKQSPDSGDSQSADDEQQESAEQEIWNSTEVIPLVQEELVLFQYYVSTIGPILDISDPSRQFSTTVPALAIRNIGLLRSLLAVAARHRALTTSTQTVPFGPLGQSANSQLSPVPDLQIATQYYYETLNYLSQNLLYPSYSKSREIIATALLISTYEMFDAGAQHSNGAWERHLRGIFWIQRAQNNNGECKDPFRRAAWWCWIRQDTWVAFREGRRVLTIWRPTRRLMDLTPDELSLRVVYICGRCVDYAANEKKYEINTRIEQGGKLLQALDDWFRALPSSFQPIYKSPQTDPGNPFVPIWIHPPAYAASIQTYHFARIIVLINQPSKGGMNDFRLRQRYLDESVETICGIAMMHQGVDQPSAFVNFPALYAAGLCVQNPGKQNFILHLLEQTLDVTKFPPKTLLNDLASYWRSES